MTSFGPGPGGQRTFALNVLLLPVSAAFSVVAAVTRRTALLQLAVYYDIYGSNHEQR